MSLLDSRPDLRAVRHDATPETTPTAPFSRSSAMLLLSQDLARAQIDQRLSEARQDRLLSALRAQRRADRARRRAELTAMRARRLLATAVIR